MSPRAKYTPPAETAPPEGDDVLMEFFENVMQASADALKRIRGKRSCRLGSPVLAMAVEAGYSPQMAYTIADAAKITGVDKQTFYREHDAGRIRWIVPRGSERGARITVEELDRWMEENVA